MWSGHKAIIIIIIVVICWLENTLAGGEKRLDHTREVIKPVNCHFILKTLLIWNAIIFCAILLI